MGRTTQSARRGGGSRLKCVNMRACRNASADYGVVEREIITALRSWLEGYRVRIEAAGFAQDVAPVLITHVP